VSGISFPGVELTIDPSAGQWIRSDLESWDQDRRESRASQFIPNRYEAYARIFHPADSRHTNLPWHQVAVRAGRTVHPEMQWKRIIRPSQDAGNSTSTELAQVEPPEEGNLGRKRAAALAGLLRDFTATPDSAWFAIWEGYGMLHDDSQQVLTSARPGWLRRLIAAPREARRRRSLRESFAAIPKLHCEHRSYLVYFGPLEAVAGFDDGTRPVSYQSPNLWWPDDRAWCVATEIDFDSTLVGGSRSAIDKVLGVPGLEALEITPQTRLDARADRINLG
jgi:hypothetical protein